MVAMVGRLMRNTCIMLAVLSSWVVAANAQGIPRLDFLVYVDGSTPLLRGGQNAPVVRIANGLQIILTHPLEQYNRKLLGPNDNVTIKLIGDNVETLTSVSGRDQSQWTRALAQLRERAGSRGSVKTDFDQVFQLIAQDIQSSQRRNQVAVVMLASDFVHDEWNATVPFCEARDLYNSDDTAPMAAGIDALRAFIEGDQTKTVFPVLIDVRPEESYIRRLSDGYEPCYRDTLNNRYMQNKIEAMDPNAQVIDLDSLEADIQGFAPKLLRILVDEVGPDFTLTRVIGTRRGSQFDIDVSVRNDGGIEGTINRLYLFESSTASTPLEEVALDSATTVPGGGQSAQISATVQRPKSEPLAAASALYLSVIPNGPREKVNVSTAEPLEIVDGIRVSQLPGNQSPDAPYSLYFSLYNPRGEPKRPDTVRLYASADQVNPVFQTNLVADRAINPGDWARDLAIELPRETVETLYTSGELYLEVTDNRSNAPSERKAFEPPRPEGMLVIRAQPEWRYLGDGLHAIRVSVGNPTALPMRVLRLRIMGGLQNPGRGFEPVGSGVIPAARDVVLEFRLSEGDRRVQDILGRPRLTAAVVDFWERASGAMELDPPAQKPLLVNDGSIKYEFGQENLRLVFSVRSEGQTGLSLSGVRLRQPDYPTPVDATYPVQNGPIWVPADTDDQPIVVDFDKSVMDVFSPGDRIDLSLLDSAVSRDSSLMQKSYQVPALQGDNFKVLSLAGRMVWRRADGGVELIVPVSNPSNFRQWLTEVRFRNDRQGDGLGQPVPVEEDWDVAGGAQRQYRLDFTDALQREFLVGQSLEICLRSNAESRFSVPCDGQWTKVPAIERQPLIVEPPKDPDRAKVQPQERELNLELRNPDTVINVARRARLTAENGPGAGVEPLEVDFENAPIVVLPDTRVDARVRLTPAQWEEIYKYLRVKVTVNDLAQVAPEARQGPVFDLDHFEVKIKDSWTRWRPGPNPELLAGADIEITRSVQTPLQDLPIDVWLESDAGATRDGLWEPNPRVDFENEKAKTISVVWTLPDTLDLESTRIRALPAGLAATEESPNLDSSSLNLLYYVVYIIAAIALGALAVWVWCRHNGLPTLHYCINDERLMILDKVIRLTLPLLGGGVILWAALIGLFGLVSYNTIGIILFWFLFCGVAFFLSSVGAAWYYDKELIGALTTSVDEETEMRRIDRARGLASILCFLGFVVAFLVMGGLLWMFAWPNWPVRYWS